MSALQLLDPRLQNLGAVPEAISSMDSSPAAEPSSSSPGLQPAAAERTAEGTAEPSAATFRRVVQASNVQHQEKIVRTHGGLRGERVKRAHAPMQRAVRGNEQMQRDVRGNEQMQRDVRGNAPHDGFCR
jgi:hypothetical protein